MRFGVLGALVVTEEDGRTLRLGGPARRRLLAALVARVGSTVTVDTLIEDLWSDLPPATAEKTLQSHVVRLRDDLGREDGTSPLVTEPGGYRLDVAPSSVDACCFERDLRAGREALAAGDPAAAGARLDQALAWWRGDPYAEFPDAVFAVSERLRLTELRSLGQESRTDAALALGGGSELVAELEARVRLEPYRERSWEQLMLALYRAGRQGDALSAYSRARHRLVEDLGVDPSASLTRLERRILDQDPSLLVVERRLQVATVPTSPPDDDRASYADPAMPDDAREVAPVDDTCPYRGLTAYGENDADVFVGRERLTAELAGRLVDDDVLVVVGPSGVGKSSLVRAGLIPALRRGAIPGSGAWRCRVVTPGSMDGADVDEHAIDLLVVDQAEELFTVSDISARAETARRLAQVLAGGTRLVLVLRADFYGRLTELDVISGRIGSATTLVGPLTEEETRRVVMEPARRHGVAVEPAMVERVVSDTQGRAGSLPLLSAALDRAWEHRAGDRLTLDDYLAGGGVRGVLESMAEATFGALTTDEQVAARRILLQLATLTGGVWTRRPVPLEDAVPHGDAVAATALGALARGRLVTVGVATAELAHESLLGGWPRLRAWLDDRALMADQLEFLASTASAWERDGRPDADLLRGPRLQAGLDWMRRHPDDLSRRESVYLAASRDAVEATLRDERRRRRRLAVVTSWTAVAALVATLVGAAAVHEKSQADAASLAADARRLAAQSYTAPDIPTAMQLAAAAYTLEDSPDTRGALLTAIKRESGVIFRVSTAYPLVWVGVATVGGPILVMDSTQTVSRVDPATRTVASSYRVFHGVVPVATSPDGTTLVVADTGTTTFPGSVYLFDATTGVFDRVLTSRVINASTAPAVAFTGDGGSLVVLEHRTDPYRTPPSDGLVADTVAVYDARQWVAPPRTLTGTVAPTGVAAGRDRIALAYADGTVEVRSAADLSVVDRARLAGRVTDIALSPDGARLAVLLSSTPLVPQLLTVGRLSAEPVPGQGLSASAESLRFSPDGSLLSAVGADGSVIVLSGKDASTVAEDDGDGRSLSGTAWGGTSSAPELLAVGLDGQLVSHDLRLLSPSVSVGAAVRPGNANAVQAGDVVVSTETLPDLSTRIRAFSLRTGGVTASWPVPLQDEERPVWLTASADGSRAVLSSMLGGGRAHIRVWDLTTGRVLLDRSQRWLFWETPLTAGMSADGRRLYQTTGRTTVDVVDIASGTVERTLTVRLLGPTGSELFPYPVADGRNGTILLLGYALPSTYDDDWNLLPGQVMPPVEESHHTLALVDGATGSVVVSRDIGPAWPTTWATSPDSARLALGLESGTVAEFDAATLDQTDGTVAAHGGAVSTVSYSPDGSTLVSSGLDGQLRLWDSASLRPLGTPTRLGVLAGVSAWFRADSTVAGIMPGSHADRRSDTFFTMPGTPAAWLSTACDVAGGSLSPSDWARYVGDRVYEDSCASPSA